MNFLLRAVCSCVHTNRHLMIYHSLIAKTVYHNTTSIHANSMKILAKLSGYESHFLLCYFIINAVRKHSIISCRSKSYSFVCTGEITYLLLHHIPSIQLKTGGLILAKEWQKKWAQYPPEMLLHRHFAEKPGISQSTRALSAVMRDSRAIDDPTVVVLGNYPVERRRG